MNEPTYLLTEAQRQTLLDCYRYDSFENKDKWVGNVAMLQSLPRVDSEPVAWIENEGFMPDVGNKKVDLNWGNGTFTNRVIANQYPWHKMFNPCIVEWRYSDQPSPQALTPITADDVTDEMIAAIKKSTPMQGVVTSERIAATYNAVIKHRSEA